MRKKKLIIGWLLHDSRYHIAVEKSIEDNSNIYVTSCSDKFLDTTDETRSYQGMFLWPNGIKCTAQLEVSTFCKECLRLHSEDLTSKLINAKLGVKNPFD